MQDIFGNIINQLLEQRWAVVNNVLSTDTLTLLRDEILQLDSLGELRQAKIGQSALQQTTIRSDFISWINEANASVALTEYSNFLEQLRSTINCELQLGLFESELHYALYRPGSFYRRHVDQFAHNKQRQLSFILYLNLNWQQEEGGILSLYNTNEDLLTTVLPENNRFICFFSDLPHDISQTNRQRLSITGWFKRR